MKVARRCTPWLVLLLACTVQAQEPVPTVQLGAEIYAATLPLAQALSVQVVRTEDGRGAKLTAGDHTLDVWAGTVLAYNAAGSVALDTCPILQDGMLYLPVKAIVGALGGSTETGAHGLTATVGKATTTLNWVDETQPVDALTRVTVLLDDPRIELRRNAGSGGWVDTLRVGIDAMNHVVGPLAPALRTVGQSRTLALLKHVPLVGGFLTTAQDVLGATSEALSLSQKLAAWDEEQGAPVRRAMAAAAGVLAKPDLAAAREARPTWQAALPALDDRLAMLATSKTRLLTLSLGLALLDSKAKDLTTTTVAGYKLTVPFTLGSARRVVTDLATRVDIARWQASTQKAWLEALLAATPEH